MTATPTTALLDLYTAIKDGTVELSDRLPTFGGEEPRDTLGVWSWDEHFAICGSCSEDLTLAPRECLNEDDAE